MLLACNQSPAPLTNREQLERLRTYACYRLGIDVTIRSRIASVIAARTAFILVARERGFTQSELGRFRGLNHSTVCIAEKNMREALTMPAFYKDYINNYNTLQQWKNSSN